MVGERSACWFWAVTNCVACLICSTALSGWALAAEGHARAPARHRVGALRWFSSARLRPKLTQARTEQ